MPKPAAPANVAFVMLLIFTSIVACSSSSKTAQAELDSLVKTKLGSHYTIAYNVSKTYALCQQSPGGDRMNRSYKFIVVKIADRKIVKEGSFKNGYVKWSEDNSIEVGSAGRDEKIDKRTIQIEEQKS